MPTRIESQWLSQRSTQAVFEMLRDGGFSARAVGGAVRNSLLGVPVDDVDIATTAKPEAVMRLAAAAGMKTVGTGLAHGTVTVVADGRPYEVTTLREDIATDGRHADVAFTDDWRADASRRDFTMNALYCEADGSLFDPLGGLSDLEARKVRFIGDPHARIREDFLRILRFFRFFAQYGSGPPEPCDVLACVQERAGLRRLSAERIRQEFVKLVCAPRAGEALSEMMAYGLLTELLPVAPNLPAFHRLTSLEIACEPAFRLASLALHVGEDADRLARHLRLSNSERHTFANYALALEWPSGGFPDDQALRVMLYRMGAKQYREVVLALRASKFPALDTNTFQSALSLPERWRAPEFPISGADVIAGGVGPGPDVGEALRQLETDWIKSGFAMNRSGLLERLVNLVQKRRP